MCTLFDHSPNNLREGPHIRPLIAASCYREQPAASSSSGLSDYRHVLLTTRPCRTTAFSCLAVTACVLACASYMQQIFYSQRAAGPINIWYRVP